MQEITTEINVMHTESDLARKPATDSSRSRSHVPGAAALPVIAFALSSHRPDAWEHELVNRLRASGICETRVWELEPSDGSCAGQMRPRRADAAARLRDVTAIVDLTGCLGADYRQDAVHGVWRICDQRGVALGDAHHGLETIATGVGIHLNLVASTASGTTLIDKAGAFACPGERVPLQRLCSYAATLLLSAIREIAVLGALEQRPAWKPDGKRAGLVRRMMWKLRELGHRLLRLLRGCLLVDYWMVGIVDLRLTEAMRSQHLPVRWIGKRNGTRYWADPFGVPGSKDEIYCEEFDLKRNVGRIVRLKLGGSVEPDPPEHVDLGLAGHLSYPYLFPHEGALYCVAESAQSRRCVLHRRDESGRWSQVAVLLNDTEVADPTIFRHQGYFWLAYTDVSLGAFDNLCLCYASDLLGPWHPHPQNPVKIDHQSSRSAGAVVSDGDQLLRVAQVCKSGYGQAVAVNRILHCTPELYREEVIRIVSPERDQLNPRGIHTMSAWGERTLVDGKHSVISYWVLQRRLTSRIASVAQRLLCVGVYQHWNDPWLRFMLEA
ncbi:glucosamine inositolphosphorylceramide transferase family protein [Cupriavidus oxalaticus]|uniref:glucosamine inositolphosphorylceramide transferase family protein n=1 Tax=Cupriavidus oxalaticus TaxID=96344 RepID=UPI00317F056B